MEKHETMLSSNTVCVWVSESNRYTAVYVYYSFQRRKQFHLPLLQPVEGADIEGVWEQHWDEGLYTVCYKMYAEGDSIDASAG